MFPYFYLLRGSLPQMIGTKIYLLIPNFDVSYSTLLLFSLQFFDDESITWMGMEMCNLSSVEVNKETVFEITVSLQQRRNVILQ